MEAGSMTVYAQRVRVIDHSRHADVGVPYALAVTVGAQRGSVGPISAVPSHVGRLR
ncbi:hypothetical protein SAMN05216219_1496 [Mycetocola miduiensis]|uniref:Uncharacterized protein n=1 Tax=Mycetocola miduiensis TaxID=995034 RepID=A0A1I5AJ27_9MICO|nr:hypothetical protein SAMN05216219_1496 [Mycetocola miduiensis]